MRQHHFDVLIKFRNVVTDNININFCPLLFVSKDSLAVVRKNVVAKVVRDIP